MKLYDDKGQPIEVPDDQAAEALASGKYGLPKGTRVPVKLEDGQAGTVAAEDLQSTLEGGAKILSPEEHAAAVQQAKYGGAGSQAVAGLAGAARGASLGTSDIAARALGGTDTADYLRNIQEANPITSGVGELAGAVAPALLTEGGSAAEEAPGILSTLGRAVAAPGRAVEAAGGLGEALASGILPEEATSLAGRLGSAAAKGAARAGAEGAVYGAGDAISEQALSQNPDLDGEKFLSAIGHGALLGAATGGLLSGTGQAGREVLGAVSPHLRGLAEEQAAHFVGGTQKFAREAEHVEGGAKAIGRDLLDARLVQAGQTIEDAAPKIAAAREDAGKAVESMRADADAKGFEGPKVGTILSTIDEKIRPDLDLLPSLNKPAIERVEALQDDIRKIAGQPTRAEAAAEGLGELPPIPDDARLGFQQAAEIRKRIDAEAKWASNPLAPVPELAKAMRTMRGAIEDEIERAGDEASKKIGGTFLEDYTKAKVRFQRMAVADDAAKAAVAKRTASGLPGALDTLGAVAGIASGHPLVGAASLASSYARKQVRERGAATAAAWLDKLGALGGVERATGAVDRQISRGVARATGDEGIAKVRMRAPVEGGFEGMRKSVEEAVAHSDEHMRAIDAAAGPIAQHSPKVAAAFQKAAVRATLYLANQLPKTPPEEHGLAHDHEVLAVSDYEKDRFEHIYQAVHDPPSVLSRVEEGTVTPDEVDAIEATAPETYASMCTQLKDALASSRADLPYDRLLAISTFLKEPVDPTMTPVFVATMQAQASAKKGGSPQGQTKRGGHAKAANLHLADTTKLTTQGPHS